MASRFLPVGLIIFGVVLRFLPHPANVAPVAAVALFGGVHLSRRWAVLLPLVIMIASDALMSVPGFRTLLPWGAGNVGFHTHAPFVWASFALVGLIGLLVRRKKTVLTVALGTVLGSITFYLITNWAVWAFGTMYPGTFAGLIESYVRALPFFRNSLLGDVAYTAGLFGAYESALYFARLQARRVIVSR